MAKKGYKGVRLCTFNHYSEVKSFQSVPIGKLPLQNMPNESNKFLLYLMSSVFKPTDSETEKRNTEKCKL